MAEAIVIFPPTTTGLLQANMVLSIKTKAGVTIDHADVWTMTESQKGVFFIDVPAVGAMQIATFYIYEFGNESVNNYLGIFEPPTGDPSISRALRNLLVRR